MNLYYATITGADFVKAGICAIDKHHAAQIMRQRIKDYGYNEKDNVSFTVKRAGSCSWDLETSIIYG